MSLERSPEGLSYEEKHQMLTCERLVSGSHLYVRANLLL